MGLTEEDYQNAIARILDRNDHDYAWGAGFLITPHYVVTCAHVVRDALGVANPDGLSGKWLTLDFPYANIKPCFAKLLWSKSCEVLLRPKWGEDLALLELKEPLQLKPLLPPITPEFVSQNHFRLVSFPKGFEYRGKWIEGKIAGSRLGGLLEMQADEPIEMGFSGTPIWIDAMQCIAGMVIVVDSDTDASAVSMSVLMEMVGRYCPLLEILRSLPSIAHSTVQAAYQQARPSKCAAAKNPSNLLEQLQELGGIDNGNNGFNCLVEFCAYLVVSAKLSRSQIREIKKWIRSEFKVDEENFEKLCDRLTSQQKQPVVIPSILVLLTPVADGYCYKIEAGYIHNVQNYDHKIGHGYEPLTVELTEPLSRQELANQMPPILEELLDQTYEFWNNLGILPQVEFFLPIPLINQDVEQYPVDIAAAQPQAIGRECRVLVRFWERLGYRMRRVKRKAIQNKWQQRWRYFQACESQTCKKLLTCGDRPSEVVRLDLNNETTIGVKIIQGIDDERRKTIQNVMYEGIPIALWLRKQLTDCSCTETLNDLLAQSLNSLPKHLTQHRKNASCQEPDHLSHHLSLLWDDPQKIPPETRLISHKLS